MLLFSSPKSQQVSLLQPCYPCHNRAVHASFPAVRQAVCSMTSLERLEVRLYAALQSQQLIQLERTHFGIIQTLHKCMWAPCIILHSGGMATCSISLTFACNASKQESHPMSNMQEQLKAKPLKYDGDKQASKQIPHPMSTLQACHNPTPTPSDTMMTLLHCPSPLLRSRQHQQRQPQGKVLQQVLPLLAAAA